jgi:hypothetical protein
MEMMIDYLRNRFKEASTWAGIGLAFTGAAAFLPRLAILAAICGAIAVLTPDYSPPK